MLSLLKISFAIAFIAIVLYGLKIFFKGGVCKSRARLDGKTIIITGGNSGIGKATAIDLAKRGAKVVIGCRSEERGEKAVIDIKKSSGNENVHLKIIDLSSFKSVRAFAEDVIKSEVRLDVLINNAGVIMTSFSKTGDGFETNFQVNYLGHFLLTNLLLDLLKKSSPSRIINVSSLAHHWASKGDLDNVDNKESFHWMTSYGLSKLSNVIFAKELSRRFLNTNVSAYSLHPGVILTELNQYLYEKYPPFKFLVKVMKPIIKMMFKNSQEGAQTTIYCAVEEGLEKYSGRYFVDCDIAPAAEAANDEEFTRKLWDYSMKATKLKFKDH